MLLATTGEILRHAQHILLVQRAGVAQQGNPGLDVGVLGRGQIALGAIELLFGVEHIDVDALPRQNALPGRRHLRGRRLHRQLVGRQLGAAADAQIELFAQIVQRRANLRVHLGHRLAVACRRLPR
jgi:hypothetical protein